MEVTITTEQFESFQRDGFVIVESALEDKTLQAARARFEPLFSGQFETGLRPDEWNWATRP